MAEILTRRANSTQGALHVWRFVDGKLGHEKQTLGLTQALAEKISVDVRDFDVRTSNTWRAEIKAHLQKRTHVQCRPDLIVGAGHATHWPMLMTRLFCGGHTVVLMSPSLPVGLFDLVFAPHHDRRRGANNVIETLGVIGPTQQSEKDANAGLILLGGVNRHFEWRDDEVFCQVESVMRANPELDWTICDSRRTPSSMSSALNMLADGMFTSWQDAAPDFLESRLPTAAQVWVTADSVSMLYEALSAGAVVGVMELPLKRPKRSNKLVRGLLKLHENGQIHLSHESPRMPIKAATSKTMSESRRCADIVLERLFFLA